MPEMDGMVEPEIVINGTALSFGQVMTVRVAIEIFASHVSETGKQGGETYKHYGDRIKEIRELMFANQPRRKATRHSDWSGDDFKMPGV